MKLNYLIYMLKVNKTYDKYLFWVGIIIKILMKKLANFNVGVESNENRNIYIRKEIKKYIYFAYF